MVGMAIGADSLLRSSEAYPASERSRVWRGVFAALNLFLIGVSVVLLVVAAAPAYQATERLFTSA